MSFILDDGLFYIRDRSSGEIFLVGNARLSCPSISDDAFLVSRDSSSVFFVEPNEGIVALVSVDKEEKAFNINLAISKIRPAKASSFVFSSSERSLLLLDKESSLYYFFVDDHMESSANIGPSLEEPIIVKACGDLSIISYGKILYVISRGMRNAIELDEPLLANTTLKQVSEDIFELNDGRIRIRMEVDSSGNVIYGKEVNPFYGR
ncbi:MAG: hypothetical protein D6769_01430 [Methanobacteriota archaeon]|nr:MAG: hypothetical protein D6769_01430 [Euryarchaeota archaeon]